MGEEENLDGIASRIISKIKHYLIVSLGRSVEDAYDEEFYRSFVWALREVIMANWAATNHAFNDQKVRKLHYLSMEYMPGRQLLNNITNISAQDIVHLVLKKMNRPLERIVNIEHDIGIGNGGLGRLASCLLDSLATQQYPAMGYGLRYQYGIFEQKISHGQQIETPDNWLIMDNPWEVRRDFHAMPVQFRGQLSENTNDHGDQVYGLSNHEEVRAIPYDYPIIGYQPSSDFTVLTLRLWSTKESPRNFSLQCYNAGELGHAAENTSLTDVLYPNDNHEMGKRVRLKQEFLLVSASLQDIIAQHQQVFGSMDAFADKVRIQINDTHPALVVAELMRLLTNEYNIPWGRALEMTRCSCSYTNHTLLKEALEEWNISRVQDQLPRQHKIIERINDEFCNQIRQKYQGDEERINRMSILHGDQIRMAHLAIVGSHKVNGVAKLHSELLKHEVFKDFYELWPDKFTNVTNGVTQRRWLMLANPKLTEFIDKRIGIEWRCDFTQISKLAEFANDSKSQEEFLQIKSENKQKLLHVLCQQMEQHPSNSSANCDVILPPTALFDIQIKRFHEYKRQIMNVLHAIMVYQELKANKDCRQVPRLILIGGKAAPGYTIAKATIRLIYAVGRKINHDNDTNHKLKICFFENYNVSAAEVIIPAADLSEQISTAGMEASGTGNMKLSMNGALTIGTEDGANIEMHEAVTDKWWPFSFGSTAEENFSTRHDPAGILQSDPKIKAALCTLIDGTFATNSEEQKSFEILHQDLATVDRYRVLKDITPYYEAQKKVEELFTQPKKWAEYAIHNMAGMGTFSTDESIKNYATKLWDLTPCPPDPKEIARIRTESQSISA